MSKRKNTRLLIYISEACSIRVELKTNFRLKASGKAVVPLALGIGMPFRLTTMKIRASLIEGIGVQL